MLYTLTCFAFWVLITCAIVHIFWLTLPWWRKKPCLWGTSVIEVLQRCSSYNQPMLNANYYQNSPPSSGLLTSFCKADNWLVSIAAADCHPLSLKLKVLLWCGGRACLAGERLLNGDSSVKWNTSEACENKVTLTLSEDHKKTQGHCSSDVDFKPKGKWATITKTFLNLQVRAWKIESKVLLIFSSPSSLPKHWFAT